MATTWCPDCACWHEETDDCRLHSPAVVIAALRMARLRHEAAVRRYREELDREMESICEEVD